MEFKDRVTQLRKENKLTQEEVGKAVGITRGSYSMYEIGKREPAIDMLSKLAFFFDVDIDYLVGKSDIRNKYNISDLVLGEEPAEANEMIDIYMSLGKEAKNLLLNMAKQLKKAGN